MARKMSEESLKNLKPFTRGSEKAREAQKKSVAKRKENIENRVARQEAKDWVWETYGQDFLIDIAKNGDPKVKADIIKALFTNDEQKIIANIEPYKEVSKQTLEQIRNETKDMFDE